MRIIYTDEALSDLENIYNYIAYNLGEPGLAKKRVDLIRKRVKDLEVFPEMHKIWRDTDMRCFPVKNHTVIYLYDKSSDIVYVMNVFYSRRNIDSLI
ncbi:MAG: type II toxin-antitoxin system RelE/ParE family toxin [Ruminococcaceae bacterium]|nr:type II toxin-antitoxin system RelE/ParE family toxin [Oscillospiraceae bacterium]